MRVKYLAQEHNTMNLVRARTWTARSGDQRGNCLATLHHPLRVRRQNNVLKKCNTWLTFTKLIAFEEKSQQ